MRDRSEASRKASETIMKKHGADFYKRIGSLGGKRSKTGGFASDVVGADGLTGRERASKYAKLNTKKRWKGNDSEPRTEA